MIKKVEFQIYESGPTMGADTPAVSGVLVNNRSIPIEIDLSLATYKPSWSTKPIATTGSWYEGCEPANDSADCKTKVLKLLPGQSKHVGWRKGAEGAFVLPISSVNQKIPDLIVIQFKRCNPLWGKCETEK